MKKTLIILTLIILLLLPAALADPEQYLTKGVDRANSYNQDGTGVWAGRTAVTTTRSGDYRGGVLVADLDLDGVNEIITVDSTAEELQVLNYTEGTGLLLKDSINIGDLSYTTGGDAPFYQTPGLIDYDSDGVSEIIVFNATHIMTYNYSTTLNLEQSTTHGITRIAAFGTQYGARYPNIKCAPSTLWADSKVHCVFPLMDKAGATQDLAFGQYNLDDNVANITVGVAIAVGNTAPSSTHLADVDNDGFVEGVYANWDGSNTLLRVFKLEVSASGVSGALIHSHNMGASALTTDVIISNMDGALSNGLEITWGYTDDGTNWEGRSVDNTGTQKAGAYCGALTCPEGEEASFNMFVCDSTTYCDFVGQDVCYYVRNANNNDPGTNTDTIHCLSRGSGVSNSETTVSNTVNFSVTNPTIHHSSINGNAGLTLPMFLIDSSTVLSNSLGGSDDGLVPVDYQITGTLDLIGFSSTSLNYYDDAYTNGNTVINSYDRDTGNPVCENQFVTFTLTISDTEGDAATCGIVEYWGNNTLKERHANTTTSANPSSVSLNYFGDEVGSFILRFNCQDQYHDTPTSTDYPVTISNDTTTCNNKGVGGGSTTLVVDAEQVEDEAFNDRIDDALGDVGLGSQVAKTFFWLLIMIGVLVGLLLKGVPVLGIAVVAVVLLVLGYVLTFISAIPLVIIGLVCAALITLSITSKMSGGGE